MAVVVYGRSAKVGNFERAGKAAICKRFAGITGSVPCQPGRQIDPIDACIQIVVHRYQNITYLISEFLADVDC